MLNFTRNDRQADAKDLGKPPAKPSPYALGPQPVGNSAPGQASSRPPVSPAAPAVDVTSVETAPAPQPAASASGTADSSGSKLIVGVNIKLKGVEISNCDVLEIEGEVDATVHSKTMEIAKPGTLNGTAQIDVAEIHGEFSGELTARTRLVVHGTGRVTGTIRYGKLVVAEGGVISGDLRQIDGSAASASAGVSVPVGNAAQDGRSLLSPQA